MTICDGPGNGAGPTDSHRCTCCDRVKANTEFRVYAGRRNRSCNKCRAQRNRAENRIKAKDRRSGPHLKRLRQKDGAPGHLGRCEACGQLVVFCTDGFLGQLVALDRDRRTHHEHQPSMTSAAASRARVAAGACTDGYFRFQTKARPV